MIAMMKINNHNKKDNNDHNMSSEMQQNEVTCVCVYVCVSVCVCVCVCLFVCKHLQPWRHIKKKITA